ncbi:TPA: type 1 fimbrial protein [Klebsiella aerogenes]|nr:type 1 fimbrial protein [Klebsiella aerogenes]HCB2865820.1 type 1 fimbrial protein [Klebsiella aerogenes]HCB2881709.1 type 1 fimbrial protein [Klebsiella aerogenes]HCB3346447.1 type 1 fimbrial protein [Klebsiella aerogenes]HCM1812543.1 type 1 fimbrial protein [Klebsiella aerogenes]
MAYQGLRISLLMTLLCLPLASIATADNWDVDGEHGELHVLGQLTEAACRLDMTSAFQQIDLGNIQATATMKTGTQGTPVPFHLQLKDCLRTAGSRRNNRTGNLTWSENQPVVSVAFLAPADADTPDLVRLDGQGVSGIGLRLMNERHQLVRLGNWNRPQFLDPGQNEMTFYVVPERTRAALGAGAFRATVDFHLNYE